MPGLVPGTGSGTKQQTFTQNSLRRAARDHRDEPGDNDTETSPGKMRAAGLVRLVYIDQRTHYRISKSEAGRPQNVLPRRLSEDARSYMTSLLDAEGVVSRIRPFIGVTWLRAKINIFEHPA